MRARASSGWCSREFTAPMIARFTDSRSCGLQKCAPSSSVAAPVNSDSTSEPVPSGWQATYSLATRFMPSRSAVTSMTSAAEYKPSSWSNGTGRWM